MLSALKMFVRAVAVDGGVAQTIGGRATEEAQGLYSTVSPTEMRAAVQGLASAAGFGEALELVADVGVLPLAGARRPEGERRALFTPRKYLPGPRAGDQPAGGDRPSEDDPAGDH